MEDRTHLMKDYREQERKGTLDQRDPVLIAGDDGKYADMEIANANDYDNGVKGDGVRGSIRKKIGSMRKKPQED